MITSFQMIPLGKLYRSPANARKTQTKEGIQGLAFSIEAHGLLNNLVVQPGGPKDTFAVLAGGRRLAALHVLASAEKIPADHPIPCNVIEIEGDISSEEISLAENEMRQQMHPADQFEAFKKLADEGQGTDTIASKFGVMPRMVEQRLKLARVSPKLIQIYRDGGMSLEQVMAFSISTDQKHQEKVWKDLPAYAKEQQRDDTVRRAMTEKHIPCDNDLAAFVGIAAYEAAGGQILRDLFSAEDGPEAFLTNAALLDKLAADKLEMVAETIRAEGWKWVAIIPDLSWDEQRKYTQRQVKTTISAEEKAEAAKLRKQLTALEKKRDDLENDNGEYDDEIDALTDKVFEAERDNEQWTVKDKEASGAIVTIENGSAEIKRGLMKAEEARAEKKAETAKAKAKTTATGEPDEAALSQSLARELTAHRTAAIQAKLAKNPKVALIAVIHALVSDTLMDGDGDICNVLQIKPGLSHFANYAEGIAKTKACRGIEAHRIAMLKKLPDDGGKLWAYLLKQDTKALLEILAVCAAPTADVVSTDSRPEADHIAAALKLDMTNYWEATADNYLGRVSKGGILEAVTEACGKAEAAPLAGMKKGDLAKAAERKLKGKGWLPAILRGGK